MRWFGLLALGMYATAGWAQQAVQLPVQQDVTGQVAESFRFVADGPAGPGWSRPDEIARKYFHENLPALFERTIVLDNKVPPRTTLHWIFTGPHAGFTVELTSSKVRISERYYDSMGLYEGQGNYPEKRVFEKEQQYTGSARTLTVIADAHLAVHVLVNGLEVLEGPLLFDVTRSQLMYAAPRTGHETVEGALLKPVVKTATVTIKPSESHQIMLGFGGSPSIPAYAELSEEGRREYWRLLKRYNLLIDEQGEIYKCGFGSWPYASVNDFLQGGFGARFKEFNAKFYGAFISSCAACQRAESCGKKADANKETAA